MLVDVEAVGVNYRDVYERRARVWLAAAAIIGVEGAGTVRGQRRASRLVERRRAAMPSGSPPIRGKLVPRPRRGADRGGRRRDAAGHDRALPRARLVPDRSRRLVLVHAAAGGVGLLLTQIAKLRGARVIGTTSTRGEGGARPRAGADEVIGYEGFAERVRELTGGEGVAAVYDGVGKATFLEGLQALRAERPDDPLRRRQRPARATRARDALAPAGSLYVQRPTLQTYTRTPELLRERAARCSS